MAAKQSLSLESDGIVDITGHSVELASESGDVTLTSTEHRSPERRDDIDFSTEQCVATYASQCNGADLDGDLAASLAACRAVVRDGSVQVCTYIADDANTPNDEEDCVATAAAVCTQADLTERGGEPERSRRGCLKSARTASATSASTPATTPSSPHRTRCRFYPRARSPRQRLLATSRSRSGGLWVSVSGAAGVDLTAGTDLSYTAGDSITMTAPQPWT